MRKNWPLYIGGVMLALLVLLGAFGHLLPFVQTNFEDVNRVSIKGGNWEIAPFTPSEKYPLGSDLEGRDLLSVMILGTKDTLLIIFFIVLIRYCISIPLSLLASRQSGLAYGIVNGLDSFSSIVPTIFMGIIIMNMPFLGAFDEKSRFLIVALALLELGKLSALFTKQFNSISSQEFVKAGIVVGNSPLRLYLHYYLPHVLPGMAVNFFMDLGKTALLVGQLGLFKYFISTPGAYNKNTMMKEPFFAGYDWPTLLAGSRDVVRDAFWVPLFPSLAIVVAIFTFYALGEGLRRHFSRKYA